MRTLLFVLLILHVEPAFSQTEKLSNVPSKTTTSQPVATGDHVWGVFHGRVPCEEMMKEMKMQPESECTKLKWAFTFFQDAKTKNPTSYKWEGSLFRTRAREGKWILLKGSAANPEAVVIQLDPDDPEHSLFLLKGDDNILFVLDGNKKMMKGTDYLSYTFNRVTN